MNNPRKHHYVPVFYLKQWAGVDNRLCEYRRVPGKIVERRTFPDGTGYETDLYRVEGLPDSLAQVFESKFMHMVDTQANEALGKIIRGDTTPWDPDMRSAWIRFVLSLRFRNPESVRAIKRQMLDVWKACVDDLQANYDQTRDPEDPATFTEFMARTDPASPHKAALCLMEDVIDNPRIGPAIFDMHWTTVSLADSSVSLLTSDRPLDMPLGLASNNAYIALPIGPKMLFVAARDRALAGRLASAPPSKVVKKVNQAVVEQARKFVWGVDHRQLRFVQNRMSKAPEREIITDEQKQRAINASVRRQNN